jgi:hypothetical protein
MFNFEVKNTDIYGTVTTLGWLKPLSVPKWFERYNSVGGVKFDITYAEFKKYFLDTDARWIHIQLQMILKASTYNPTINLYLMTAEVDHDSALVSLTLAFSTIISTYKYTPKNSQSSNYPLTLINDQLSRLEYLVTDPTLYPSLSRAPAVSDNGSSILNAKSTRMITMGESIFDIVSRACQTFRFIFGFGWNTYSPNQTLANAYTFEASRKTRWTVQAVAHNTSWLAWKRQYQALNIRTSGRPTTVVAGVPTGNNAMLTEAFKQSYDFTRLAQTVTIDTDGPESGLATYYYRSTPLASWQSRGTTKAGMSEMQAAYSVLYASGNAFTIYPAGLHTGFEWSTMGTSLNSEEDGYLIWMLAADIGYHYANTNTTMATRTQHSHLRRELRLKIPEVTVTNQTSTELNDYILALGNIAQKALQAHASIGGQTEVTLKNVILPFWGTQYDPLNDPGVTLYTGGTPTANRLYACPNLFIGRMVNLDFKNGAGADISTWGLITGYEFEDVGNGFIKANITLSQNPYSSLFETQILADVNRRVNRR